MRRWTNEVIVGAAILLALGLGMYGYVFLREIPARQRGFVINVTFDNVTGLETGDPVLVSGVKVGRVKQMKLDRGRVAVRVWLNGEVPFAQDSRAAIRSVGMIGEKYIDLMPGTAAAMLKDGDMVSGAYVSDIADAGGSLSDLMGQANALLVKLNIAMENVADREADKALANALVNANSITTRIDKNFASNMAHVEKTLASMDTLTTAWKEFWTRREGAIDSTTEALLSTAAQLSRVIPRVDSVLTVTQDLLARVQNQNGTAGKVINDAELYDKANNAVDELQNLLDDVKANPSKYLHVSLIDLF